jgi:hypothetical protein
VIAPVPVADAGFSLFFHVTNFAARRHFAILADYASAGESGEAEKPNQTHDVLIPFIEAILVPMSWLFTRSFTNAITKT